MIHNISRFITALALLATAQTAWAWDGSGTAESPYQIKSTADLDQLATDVNSGTTYANKYFVLTTDLTYDPDVLTIDNDNDGTNESNYTAIGFYKSGYKRFSGHFDGQNHTISGIRIYKGGNADADKYQGIFAVIANVAEVKNVFLANTSITGSSNCGGIIGRNEGTVSNCHVLSTVTVHGVYYPAYNHGGIVGINRGTVTGCTSAASVTGTSSSLYNGGIAGGNEGTVSDCIYLGNTIEGSKRVGAIVGDNSATVRNCYYISTTFQGKENHGYTLANDASATGYNTTSATVTDVRLATSDDFAVSGDTYTIGTAAGWSVMCAALYHNDTYNRFSGKTVQLGADITVTRMAGSAHHDFMGTFDGQGHTLTVNISSDDITDGSTQYVAPFRYVSNTKADPSDEAESPAAFRNLHVTGTITTDKQFTGGLIGGCWGTVSIDNCAVSTAITSTISGDGSHGGIVGIQQSGALTITGCLFDGSLLGATTYAVGGFLGYRKSGAEIRNSLFAPAEVTVMNTSGATFARNKVDTYNSYYTYYLCDGTNYAPYDPADADHPDKYNNGHATRTVAAADDVTIGAVALTGTATQYTVSGITAYSGGGLQRGQTLYYGSGDQLSLTLSNSATAAPQGYQYAYTASAGTLSGSTLTMPDEDVTISVNTAALAPIDWATVNLGNSEEDPYMIYNKDQLLLLAHRVNGTSGETANEYEGMYFKLGADITFTHPDNETEEYVENYEAIGGYIDGTERWFYGNFDGDGHTVSGIRIRKTGSDDANSIQGLFGYIGIGADIRNVHLTDARITGYQRVAGIVGFNLGTVSGCTVTDSYITCNAFEYGTICGMNAGTLTNNYYHGCTVKGTPVTSGKGCNGADITANHGALPAYAITLGANITTPPGTFAGQTEWLDTPPVSPRLAPGNGFTLAGNHYFASGYEFTPGSTLASGAAQGYTPRATLGSQLLDLYTPTGDADPLAGTAIARLTVTADCDGKTLASTQAIYSTREPVTVAYTDADGTPGETSAIALDGTEISLAAGTYFAGLENVNFDHTVKLTGDVTLILKDGCTMNVGTSEAKISGHGIARESGGDQALTIYGQNAGTGALNVYTDNGNRGIVAKAVTINGGNVTIDANGNDAAGISAGDEDITINGGHVSVTAPGTDAWAIYAYNNVTINGGTVEASGTADGIRIDNGTIAINGGTVNASGSYGINASYGYGTITLGWTNPADRITASSYSGTVQVADGKKLHNGSDYLYGTLGDPAAALNGKTLRPAATATYTTADGTAATADAILLDASDNSLPAGNYLATGTLNYTHGITLAGDVTLILADNCHMNVGTSGEGRFNGYGINGASYTLDITSEANGSGNGNGALSIYTTGMVKHGINAKAITIDGGNVTADVNGDYAVALNAGHDAVTINGGTLSATATGSNADAIFAGGNFNYNGGNVTATNATKYAIRATGGNYTFSWRTPADRITIGATGLYAPAAKTATFARLFTDGSDPAAPDPADNYYGGTYTGDALTALAGQTLSGITEVTLTEDNATQVLAAINGISGISVTFNRAFTASKPSTICLPFDYTKKEGDGSFYAFTSIEHSGGEYIATMTEPGTETLTANTPYLYLPSATGNVEFSGTPTTAIAAGTTTSGDWTFQGTYDEVKWDTAPTGIYGFSAQNVSDQGISQGEFVKVGAKVRIRPLRAYLKYKNGTENYSAAPTRGTTAELPDRIIVRLIGSDGNTTAIGTLDTRTGEVEIDTWYDLNGRKLSAKPTHRGIYINNGRKVVIK